MKNILVVGGAGYIGSHCCKLLKQNNFNPIVLDNFSTGHKEFIKWGAYYEGNLGDANLLDKIFSENNIDLVMHFAAFASVGESVQNPIKYYQNNVLETITLLNSMIKNNIKNFVFSSTCATYGVPKGTQINENDPQIPINPYGRSKLMIEEICADYDAAYGLKTVILRYFNAAGADFDCEIGEIHNPETHLIPIIIKSCLDMDESFTIFGNDYETADGTCVRDYIHVNDICDAHVKAINWLSERKNSESFNLGNEVGYSVIDVINKIKEISHISPKYEFGDRREGDPPYLVAKSEKAHSLLNWKPKYKLDDIVSSAWEFHKRKG